MTQPNYISPHFQKVHYPSSSIRDFRAADGLNGGQVGDPVKLVNVTETEYQYKYNGFEYQDELGFTFGLVSYQYLHRDTGAGPSTIEKTIETSHTMGIGPVQFGTKDGKPFIGAGVGFRAGFIGGVVLGGSMGIRKK